LKLPEKYQEIEAKSKEVGFSMPSDISTGALLRNLVTSKPVAHFLELGTGTGLALAWLTDGMDEKSSIISIDNDPQLIQIASSFFKETPNTTLICADAAVWIKSYEGSKFDLIFADAWPGKYSEIDEVLALVKPTGFYVIDDMTAQPNWPEGHEDHVRRLVTYLENRDDFRIVSLNWSTGIIIATRKPEV